MGGCESVWYRGRLRGLILVSLVRRDSTCGVLRVDHGRDERVDYVLIKKEVSSDAKLLRNGNQIL